MVVPEVGAEVVAAVLARGDSAVGATAVTAVEGPPRRLETALVRYATAAAANL